LFFNKFYVFAFPVFSTFYAGCKCGMPRHIRFKSDYHIFTSVVLTAISSLAATILSHIHNRNKVKQLLEKSVYRKSSLQKACTTVHGLLHLHHFVFKHAILIFANRLCIECSETHFATWSMTLAD